MSEDEELSNEEPLEEEETQEQQQEENPETQETQETEETEDNSEDNDFDKPVEEGDIVEVEVEDLGSKGDGIARKEGFVIFVPGGEVGETYDVEVTSVGRKFAFAEIQD